MCSHCIDEDIAQPCCRNQTTETLDLLNASAPLERCHHECLRLSCNFLYKHTCLRDPCNRLRKSSGCKWLWTCEVSRVVIGLD